MKLVTEHLHMNKEEMWSAADRHGLTDEEAHKLRSALLEVEFQVDVEAGKIVVVEGHPLERLPIIDEVLSEEQLDRLTGMPSVKYEDTRYKDTRP